MTLATGPRSGQPGLVTLFTLGCLPDVEQLIGFPERDALQQDTVYHREHCSSRPDPEAECQNGDGGEERALAQRANPKTHVGQGCFE